MIYLVKSEYGKCDILDTDDMVIESVSREELLEILRSEVKIQNIDVGMVFLKPDTVFYLSHEDGINRVTYGNRGNFIVIVPDMLIFEKDCVARNKKENYYFKFTKNPSNHFILWFDGYFYDMEVAQVGAGYFLVVNGELRYTLSTSQTKPYSIRMFGYIPSKEIFRIDFHGVTIDIYKNCLLYQGTSEGDVDMSTELGIKMSESEFRRILMFA